MSYITCRNNYIFETTQDETNGAIFTKKNSLDELSVGTGWSGTIVAHSIFLQNRPINLLKTTQRNDRNTLSMAQMKPN